MKESISILDFLKSIPKDVVWKSSHLFVDFDVWEKGVGTRFFRENKSFEVRIVRDVSKIVISVAEKKRFGFCGLFGIRRWHVVGVWRLYGEKDEDAMSFAQEILDKYETKHEQKVLKRLLND